MNKTIGILLFLLFAISGNSVAQSGGGLFDRKKKKPLIKIRINKFGPYLGIQRGAYTIAEAGVEYHWKKIELRDALSHSVHAGFNYNFKHNILGYDVGYWVKPHRIGLTYGANAVFRTNFHQHRLGLAPVIGFKFWILHLQTGYHFLPNVPKQDFETNTFFISLRAGIANERSVNYKLRNGKKKKVKWLGK